MKGLSLKIVQSVEFHSRSKTRCVDRVVAILDVDKVIKPGKEYGSEMKIQVRW